jgi:hypothetical protein
LVLWNHNGGADRDKVWYKEKENTCPSDTLGELRSVEALIVGFTRLGRKKEDAYAWRTS